MKNKTKNIILLLSILVIFIGVLLFLMYLAQTNLLLSFLLSIALGYTAGIIYKKYKIKEQ